MTGRGMTEKELFQRQIWDACRTLGLDPPQTPRGQPPLLPVVGRWGWLFHIFDPRRSPAGFPDLFMLNPYGCTKWVELKMIGKRPSPAQVAVMNLLRAGGHDVSVWDASMWPDPIMPLLHEFRHRRPVLLAA
jgi:hypothetical protein